MSEWATIKIKKEVKKKIEEMGLGISRAVEKLVEMKEKAIKESMRDFEEMGQQLADIILQSGLFDIKIKGGGIIGVEEEGEDIVITGVIRIGVPDPDIRASIKEVLQRE